ncbi:MAG: Mur ligase family protein [Aquabacterium sp.]
MSDSPHFTSSRRLTGPNLYFAQGGAVLQAPCPVDAALATRWLGHVAQARQHLGWPDAPAVVRHHAGGAALALAAPVDQWMCATHANEWAWLSALGQPWTAPDDAGLPTLDALAALKALSAAERDPALLQLLQAAQQHAALPLLLDDDQVSLGLGRRSQAWPRAALPTPGQVDWSALGRIPCAQVTGTNGKTTSVRLIAAMARAAGLRAGHCSTEGLVVDGQILDDGDCAGPDSARRLLRQAIDLAVLETARGGLLRRGLALDRADVALITNVSADHLGEYGIDTLDHIADVKWLVASTVQDAGLLVLPAADALLRERARAHRGRIGWFGLDDAAPLLQQHRAQGGATCGVRLGQLRLADAAQGLDTDLGPVDEMPLSAGGHAAYNIANLAGAALAGHGLGLPLAAIREVLHRFGRDRADNPGRLEHWVLDDVQVWLDFAHNPDGLSGLLAVARASRSRRLALVLGQAGDRTPAELQALAAAAAAAQPDRIIVKELPEYARGRAPGEVVRDLVSALRAGGMPAQQLQPADGELQAVTAALAWAQAGDALVLPVHASAARDRVRVLLDQLAAARWRAGMPLPD